MKFRTEYVATPSSLRLNPHLPILLLGSCFSTEVGEKMRSCCWDAISNPFGVLYNPASIAMAISASILKDSEMDELISYSLDSKPDGNANEIFSSRLTDSKCNSFSRELTTKRVKERLLALRKAICRSQAMVVTFGTAWIYEMADKPGTIVANCHKFPASRFKRRRLDIDEIVQMWMRTAELLREVNPQLKLIFTVSPIRHLKDGFEGNSISKATLLLACEKLCEQLSDATYFPAYEIICDDLRDYRFYASDLTHPSAEAVEYVWEKFCSQYLSDSDRGVLREGEKIAKMLRHISEPLDDSPVSAITQEKRAQATTRQYNHFLALHPGMKVT